MLDLKNFTPKFSVPLAVSFVQQLYDSGYRIKPSFDYFDYYVGDDTGTKIAVKTIKNGISASLRRKLVTTSTPMKVLLVEGENPAFEQFKSLSIFLAQVGTGVFVKNVGWVVLPRTTDQAMIEPLRFKIAPRWREVQVGDDTEWRKTCTSCGRELNPDDFYDNPNKTAKDPKRNQCIDCMRRKARKSD